MTARSKLLLRMVILLSPFTAHGATMDLWIVRINDEPIEPSQMISVQTGDSFTVEAYLSDWDVDEADPQLEGYQVSLRFGEMCPDPFGSILLPEGLEALPRQCHADGDCLQTVPLCESGTCVRPCADSRYCPMGLPDCVDGLCFSDDPDAFQRYNFVDRTRADSAFSDTILAICRFVSNERTIAFGCVAPGNEFRTDNGSPLYLGTVTFDTGYLLCGPREIGLDLRGSFIVLDSGLLDPAAQSSSLTVHIKESHCDKIRIEETIPKNFHRLARAKRNAIKLRTSGPFPGAQVFQGVPIYALNSETCRDGLQRPEDNLTHDFGVRTIYESPFQFDTTVIQDESPNGVLQHAQWYRFEGLESPTGSCHLDYCVLIGDVDDNGIVDLADLSRIHSGIPTLNAEATDRRDVNGDGFINYFDMSVAFAYVGSVAPPYPCR